MIDRVFLYANIAPMLIIRLQRVGKKNDPSFRLVVTENARAPKSGGYLEILGSYNPRKKQVSLKEDRIKHWLICGAQISATAHNILVSNKVIDAPKIKKGRG